MQCEDLAEVLAAVSDGSPVQDQRVHDHIESCLRCQAELVQYRKLLRAMRALRTQIIEPAPGLVAEVLATIEEAGERHAVRSLLSGRRTAYLVGVGAATAAGAAGALVLASRSRGRRPRLVG